MDKHIRDPPLGFREHSARFALPLQRTIFLHSPWYSLIVYRALRNIRGSADLEH